jgi:hypothetical protein
MMNIIFALLFLIVFSFPTLGFCESAFFDSTADLISKKLIKSFSNSITQGSRDDCFQEYSKLYKNGTLRVSVFLGLMDTPNGSLWDRPAKHSLIEYLTKECYSDNYACGFIQKSSDPNVFQKTTIDFNNIIINIHDSSVSDSYESNNTELLLAQQEKSKRVTNLFLESIEKNDIVFYIGHSRFGTGPGFYLLPPLSSQWLLTYIYSPVLSATLRKLEQTSTPPKIFGIFGCSSQKHYAKKIHSAAPDMALILTTGITLYDQNIGEAVHALNSILGNICYSDDFGGPIRLNPNSNAKCKLFGLFENNKFPKFQKNNSLLSITIFILTLPLIIITTSKLSSTKTLNLFDKRAYFINSILLLTFPILTLQIIAFFSKKYNGFNEQSFPIFIILSGVLLLLRFSFHQKNILSAIIRTIKSSTIPLLLSILFYFLLNFLPDADINHLYLSTIKSVKFLVLFFVIFPFAFFSTEIMKFPLFGDKKLHLATRILLLFIISGTLYAIISYSASSLNPYFVPYRNALLIFFFYNQLISLFLYYYKSSTLLSIIYQTLTLAFIFSENIHGLLY